MDTLEQKIDIAEKEHKAGHHEGRPYLYEKVCHECHKAYEMWLVAGENNLRRINE